MNVFDKLVATVNPQKGLQRYVARQKLRVLNSGYSEAGGSTVKKSMKGWNFKSSTPAEDIYKPLDTLRQRSRSLYTESPLAVSAIKNNRSNVIGSGLQLRSKIDFDYLGLTEKQADKWQKVTQREFKLWAETKLCDRYRLNNFYEMQQLALTSYLLNGDAFALLTFRKNLSTPYQLQVGLIEADRVCNPNSPKQNYKKLEKGNKIYCGVEIDKQGAVVAYHICDSFPNDKNNSKKEWKRVKAYGKKTGIQNVIHVFESERVEQYRGVPYLAPVIESLKQISRYTQAEITSAVISAFFTAFITRDKETEGRFGECIPEEEQIENKDDSKKDNTSIELGAGTINMLGPGEDVKTVASDRPNPQFDAFTTSVAKQIGAALEVPYEMLIKNFQSNYSASRAALLEAWKTFRMRRDWFSKDFCQPIYEVWLCEAVARGRIEAPGFFSDVSIRKAWSGSEWNGPSAGQIDPSKEIRAAERRVKLGISTREQEAIQLCGNDIEKVIPQLKREAEMMAQIEKVGGVKGGES